MKFKKQCLVAMISAISASSAFAQTDSNNQDEKNLETMVVTGEKKSGYAVKDMNTATKLDLSIRQTPQSVSVVNEKLMQDFQLNTVNDALSLVTGVQIERPETDRVYYSSRGFEITNFQVDGVGMPLSNGNVLGDIDTALFERIEILRGANGLTAGKGDPSATVNMVRKRPTIERLATIGVTTGSWNKVRLDADVSGEITTGLRGRLVAAKENTESYLDRYERDLTLGYGVVEADLSYASTLTLGHSVQQNDVDSPLWGALPLVYIDGSPTNYDRSTSSAADWAFFNTDESRSFVEFKHAFNNGWSLNASYNYVELDTLSNLFYVAGTPSPVDESGVVGAYASEYTVDESQKISEVFASGPFSAFGNVHELVIGANYTESKVKQNSLYDDRTVAGFYDASVLQPINVAEFDGNYTVGDFTNPGGGGVFDDTAKSVYTTAKLNLTDNQILVLGGRYSEWQTRGEAYGTNQDADDDVVIPYVGYILDIASNVSVYGSYTETFTPQTELNENLQRLDAKSGVNYELGFKAEVGDANITAAVFETKLENVATFKETVNGNDIYEGKDGIESRGIEFDVVGEIREGLNLASGFTVLEIEDAQGEKAMLHTPRETANITVSYATPFVSGLTLGFGYDWQGEIENKSVGYVQDAYGLSSIAANYQVTPKLKANVKVNNLGDEKYINSLKWDQGYYGAPRNFTASLVYDF